MSKNIRTFFIPFVWLVLCGFLVEASAVELPEGQQLASIPRVVKRFLLDPARPRIYGTTTVNTVIAIDTQARAMVGEIAIGLNPDGLDISPDGTRLYVANLGSRTEGIGVVDLTTFTKLPSLPTPGVISSVAAGLNDRLYVGGPIYENDFILAQISATDGAVQAHFGQSGLYSPCFGFSADRETLFVASRDMSGFLASYDISGLAPVLKETNQNRGLKGETMVVNHAGTKIGYLTMREEGDLSIGKEAVYSIPLISTVNLQQTLGRLICAPNTTRGAFSSDDQHFFTAPSDGNRVEIFDANTLQKTDSFATTSAYFSITMHDLVTNHEGTELYLSNEYEVLVYNTRISPAAQITSEASATIHQDDVFSFQVTSSIAGANYTAVGLPDGLTIDRNGLISGTAIKAGEFNIHIAASSPDEKVVAGADFYLSILTPFTVLINGHGSVPDQYAGTTWRKIGSKFELTATPDDGYAFYSWTGSVPSTGTTYLVKVASKMVLTATFVTATPITVSVVGPGMVNYGFLGTTPQVLGRHLSITASAITGAHFVGWSGSITSSQYILEFVVEPNLNLVANFEQDPKPPVADSASIAISASGPGSVTPRLAGTTAHEIGTWLTVQATPEFGGRFLGWSGSIVSTSSSLTFAVQPGMSLVANFDALAPSAGSYHLFGAGPSLTARVTSDGLFTGFLTLDGKRYSFGGNFLGAQGFDVDIVRGSLPVAHVHLVLSQSGGAAQIVGTVDTGSGPVELAGNRLGVFSKNAPAPQVGKYTWGAPPGTAAGAPGGASFGTARVQDNGGVTLAGTLGDGTPFSVGGQISDGGDVAIYRPLYARKGFINGHLHFREVEATSDFDGTLSWSRPTATRGFFSAGFETSISVVGSRLALLAKGENLLSGTSIVLRLDHGSLDAGQNAEVTLLPGNRLTAAPSDPLSLRLGITPSTQTISGSFVPPAGKARKSFRGVILAKPQSVYGQSRDTAGFGSVQSVSP